MFPVFPCLLNQLRKATSVSLSSKRNATRAHVQEVVVDRMVLDLFNVDESLEMEALEHTQWELEPGEQKS